mgnify:CR=1 FL=1
MQRRLLALGIVLVVAIALAYVYVSRRPDLAAGTSAPAASAAAPAGAVLSQRPVAVVTAPVERIPLAVRIEAVGTARANEAVHDSIQRLVPPGLKAGAGPTVSAAAGQVQCDFEDGLLRIATPHYVVEMDQAAGGGIVRAYLPSDGGQELLGRGVSNDIVSYRDTGGLWRMGHEFRGGRFRESGRASAQPARLEVERSNGTVEVTCETSLQGEVLGRRLAFDPAYAVRMVSDMVPNAWIAREIVGELVAGLQRRGFADETLGKLHGLLIEQLRGWLTGERDRMA